MWTESPGMHSVCLVLMVLVMRTAAAALVTSDLNEDSKNKTVVTNFLEQVETYALDNSACTKATSAVVKLGAQFTGIIGEKYKNQSKIAIDNANDYTILWQSKEDGSNKYEGSLYGTPEIVVTDNPGLHAIGFCYDKNVYRDRKYFCPFGYVDKLGDILVLNKRNYSHEDFFKRAKEKGLRMENNYYKTVQDVTTKPPPTKKALIPVSYADGVWGEPFFDCKDSQHWLMAFSVPFFGMVNNIMKFKGVVVVEVDLHKFEINQCPGKEHTNAFASSDRCKETTQCQPVRGLGFRRGSYTCVCKDAYTFPQEANSTEVNQFFDGIEIEREYANSIKSPPGNYSSAYECVGSSNSLRLPAAIITFCLFLHIIFAR